MCPPLQPHPESLSVSLCSSHSWLPFLDLGQCSHPSSGRFFPSCSLHCLTSTHCSRLSLNISFSSPRPQWIPSQNQSLKNSYQAFTFPFMTLDHVCNSSLLPANAVIGCHAPPFTPPPTGMQRAALGKKVAFLLTHTACGASSTRPGTVNTH